MGKLATVNIDNTLNISVEEKLFENIRKAHTWFTNPVISFPAFIIFAIIDITGFLQIMESTLAESWTSRFIITTSLAIAFEVAPLYIGYSICLKCYRLGRKIHNWVLLFSCSACVLGIVGNTIFRINTIDIAYINPTTNTTSEVGVPVTVIMCILPVITSLMSLVIGCLTIDPLQFDLLRLSKKLAKLKLRRQRIMAYLEEFADETALQTTLKDEETACYKKVLQEIYAMKTTLKTYTIIKTGLYTTKNN